MAELSDEYLKHLGEMTVAFQKLEGTLCVVAGILLCDDEDIASCVTTEISFKNLVHLVASLHKIRHSRLKDKLDQANQAAGYLEEGLKLALAAEEMRNRITQSRWYSGYRHKMSAKMKHGLRSTFIPATVQELKDAIRACGEAEGALAGFHIVFMQVYNPCNPDPPTQSITYDSFYEDQR